MLMTLERNAAHWSAELVDQGYCIIRGTVARSLVARTSQDLDASFGRTPLSVGPFYGGNTRRFHGLLARSPRISDFVAHGLILSIVNEVLGPNCDHIQLNLTQAIEIVEGGEGQPPHRDQDMWPVRTSGVEYLVNVMWPFSSYTEANGATRIWPDSHRRQGEILLPEGDAITAEMEPGDVLLFLGSTLHAGGANRTPRPRRGMIISYSLGWLKPYELSWLAYPPDVARTFPPQVAALAGYRAHRPNLGTYEGRCPSFLLQQDGDTEIGAIDALRPEQEALIAAYRRGDIGPGFIPPTPTFHETQPVGARS